MSTSLPIEIRHKSNPASNPFPFHYGKAAQAIAALLRFEIPHRMNYYRLLKLIYIANRASLQETGRAIFGGRTIAMERGPLNSTCLDLIKGRDVESPWWSNYFRTHHFDVEMIDDPGNGELSANEIDLLNRVRSQHESQDEWELGRHTQGFEEFKKNPPPTGGARTIPFSDLLAAVGRSQDEAEILKDAKEMAAFDRIFG
jgi:hypothetical protein